MSARLESWIRATRSSVTAALAAPADTERLLEAFCAIDALASVMQLLDEARHDPMDGPDDRDADDSDADDSGTGDSDAFSDPVDSLGLSASERRALIARGKLGMGPSSQATSSDDDDALALRLVRSAAKRGLARLTGPARDDETVRSEEARSEPARGERVPELTLLRLVRGELDGFRAQEVARRIAASAEARLELRLLLGIPNAADGLASRKVPSSPTPLRSLPTLRLAADGPAEVRDPSKGAPAGSLRVVTSEGELELEAVRFEDGVLGIYASRAVPLVLAGSSDAWTVRGSAPGYLELEHQRVEGDEHSRIALRIEDREALLELKAKRS